MITALKAEFRKLFTIRTTYIFIGLALLFTIFFAFYIEGFRLTGAQLRDPNLLADDVTNAIGSLPTLFGAIIAILLITHEYRYNTIMYTLTSSNSRSRVLFAKLFAITVFAVVLTLAIGVLSPLMSYLGVHAHGHTLIHQSFDIGSLLWRGLFYGWGYITLALILGALIRNQIGAIVSVFIIPTFEQVLSLLFKHNSVYLPFTSVNAVLAKPEPRLGVITYSHAALVFLVYLVIGWIVAWTLFLRRDAN